MLRPLTFEVDKYSENLSIKPGAKENVPPSVFEILDHSWNLGQGILGPFEKLMEME